MLMHPRLRPPVPTRAPRRRTISLWGLSLVAAAQLAFADPAVEGPSACASASAQEAQSLAEQLYERGDYQHAGACYQAAGDLAHANLAYLKAAGPTSEDTARDLKSQRDAAKALFAGVARAFRGNH